MVLYKRNEMHLEKKRFQVKLIILSIFYCLFPFLFLWSFFHAMPYLAEQQSPLAYLPRGLSYFVEWRCTLFELKRHRSPLPSVFSEGARIALMQDCTLIVRIHVGPCHTKRCTRDVAPQRAASKNVALRKLQWWLSFCWNAHWLRSSYHKWI